MAHCSTCTCHLSGDQAAAQPSRTDLTQDKDCIELEDERIASLELDLIRLKRHRNDLVPVNRLPPELLADIFVCHKDSQLESILFNSKPEVLTASHVSYQWRVIALSTPVLWNTPDLRLATLSANMISRTGNIPLRVRLSPIQSLLASDLAFYRDQQPVACKHTLDPSVLESAMKSKFSSSIDVTGSEMELNNVLRLCTPDCNTRFLSITYQASDADAQSSEVFTPPILHLDYGQLDILCLRNCVAPWNSSVFHTPMTLRHLEVRKWPTRLESQSTALVGVLRYLPALEHLHFQFAIDLPHTGLEPVGPPVELRRLARFIVEDYPKQCIDLLGCVRLPGGCNISISCYNERSRIGRRGRQGEYTAQIAKRLFMERNYPLTQLHVCSDSSMCSLHGIFAAANGSRTLVVSAQHSSLPPHTRPFLPSAEGTIFDSPGELLAYFVPFLSTCETRSLVLSIEHRLDPYACAHMFADTRAREVVLAGRLHPGFLQALGTFPALFPNLHTLELRHAKLDTESSSTRSFWASFEQRARDGALRVLRLRSSDVGYPELVPRWRTVLEELDMDAHTLATLEESVEMYESDREAYERRTGTGEYAWRPPESYPHSI